MSIPGDKNVSQVVELTVSRVDQTPPFSQDFHHATPTTPTHSSNLDLTFCPDEVSPSFAHSS